MMASIAQNESKFILNTLARINTIIDLIRRSYNRATQWFNLSAISFGRFNRAIPYIGLVLNLSNLTLRAIINSIREKNSSLMTLGYIGLISFLALSSIFIVINTGPMSIVWFTISAAFTRVVLDGLDILYHLPLLQRAKTRMNWQEISHDLEQEKRQKIEQQHVNLLCKIALICKLQENTGLSPSLLLSTLAVYEQKLGELDNQILQMDEAKTTHEKSLHQIGLSTARLMGGLIVAVLTTLLFTLAITNPAFALNIVIAIEAIECVVLSILFQQFLSQSTDKAPLSMIERAKQKIDDEVVVDSYIKMQHLLEKNEGFIDDEQAEQVMTLIDETMTVNTDDELIDEEVAALVCR